MKFALLVVYGGYVHLSHDAECNEPFQIIRVHYGMKYSSPFKKNKIKNNPYTTTKQNT